MHFRVNFPLVFSMLVVGSIGVSAVASQDRREMAFQQGLAAFQKSDFKQARTSFQEALQGGDNPTVLFDLGLTEQRLGNQGMALALWRKALAKDADFTPAARAIEWTRRKLDRAEIAHEVELWESLRSSALVTVPLWNYLLSTAALLLASGWLILRYLGLRRRARLDEKPTPPFPFATGTLAVLLAFFLFLSAAKAFDEQVERATVIEKKVSALSSPSNDATPLFDLYEGLEVIVRGRSDAWTQITYPGGSTGWVPGSAIFSTKDTVAR